MNERLVGMMYVKGLGMSRYSLVHACMCVNLFHPNNTIFASFVRAWGIMYQRFVCARRGHRAIIASIFVGVAVATV